MCDFIAGYICGNLKGERHFIGSFHDSKFIGNLMYVNLSNDNICDCIINKKHISGTLEGKYYSDSSYGDIKADLSGNINETKKSERINY